jgi:DeoR/GlpR family transcriptional regulator of sugar metabolism
MARRAREVVVLTESSKFPRQGAVQLLPVTGVKRLVTDTNLPLPIQNHLTGAGITVTLVPAS